jgi:hypothetical protein
MSSTSTWHVNFLDFPNSILKLFSTIKRVFLMGLGGFWMKCLSPSISSTSLTKSRLTLRSCLNLRSSLRLKSSLKANSEC